MKKNFVFWKKPAGDPVIDGFSRNPEYHAFFNKCNEVFEFRFADYTNSYIGNGIFKNVSRYEKGRIIPAEPEFKADVIYQFKKMTDENFDYKVKIINSPEFRNWCGDKWEQYQLLGEFMTKTFLITSENDLIEGLKLISTKKAVLKPNHGQKGEDVTVFEKTHPPKLDPEILKNKKYLLQEFADTNITIDGIVSGIHDIKLITIGDHIFANLRTPENNLGEVCTFDSPYSEISISKLPADILDFHKKIKERVETLFKEQIYTVDIGITKNGPVVFELNPHTAFPYIHFEYAEEFLNAMVDIFDK
ncbi:MAG: hypothetical protein WC603_01565 [Candidatus Paceibacterota bacterium]